MSKKRIFFFSTLIFLLFLALFLFKVKPKMKDFEVNYKAAQRIRWAETLYRIEDGHYQFKYSPFSAFLYLPLTFFPLSVAKEIWFFIVLTSLGIIILLSAKLLYPGKKAPPLSLALPALILLRFFLRELELGQINAFLTFLLLIAIWFLQDANSSSSPKEIYAGLFWGLAAALKPYALIFFPYFILKKKWKTLISGIFLFGLSLVSPSIFYGNPGNMKVLEEWATSLSQSTPPLLASQDNISFMAFFVKWTANQNLSFILYLILTAFLTLLVLWLIKQGKRIDKSLVLDCSFLLVLIPLLSPLGWDYTLLSSILGIGIVLKHFFYFPKVWRFFLLINFSIIAFSLYDLLGREFYAAFMSRSVLTINFLILVASLAYLRFRGHC